MFDQELSKAIEAARKAGDIIAGYYHANYEVHHKNADQPVTIADREANEAIRSTLLNTFPDDGWFSEESADTSERFSKKRVWIVDPLDGTKEFIAKIPEFGVSIALVFEGKPVVGVIYNPIKRELFSSQKGGGAFLNEKKISVSQQKEFSKAILVASRSEIKRGEWKPYEKLFSILPSGGMACKMCEVARGNADGSFSLSPKNEWDFAAGTLLVIEAGGIVSALDGESFVFNKQNPFANGIIHGNSSLYSEILKLVKKQV